MKCIFPNGSSTWLGPSEKVLASYEVLSLVLYPWIVFVYSFSISSCSEMIFVVFVF